MYVRGCFIVSVDISCFRKFKTPRHDMVDCFVVFVTHPAQGARTVFDNAGVV